MRLVNAVLLAAAVLTFGACTNTRANSEPAPAAYPDEPVAAAPAVAPAPATDDGSSTSYLRPRDVPADWTWTGQALPNGNLRTGVLTLEKFAPAEVNANQSYTSTIRVRNISSTVNLAEVVVTDLLPEAGYEVLSMEPKGERDGNTLVWDLGHLNAGREKTITVTGRATGAGTLMNCATIAYTPIICVHTNVVVAGLAVRKFAPAAVNLGDEIPIRIVVTNPGTGTATRVRITDDLPKGWTVNGQKSISFDVGSLKGGESREFSAIALASTTGKFTNTAHVTGDGKLIAEASVTTSVHQPAIEITKSANIETQILDRPAIFTINVTNPGDGIARDVVLTDNLTGAERIIAASDGGSVVGSTIGWNLGNIPPGATRTVTVSVERTTAGQVSGIATARSTGLEPVSASAKVNYIGVPAVLMTITDSPDPVLIGDTTTYTIIVTNQGTAPDSEIFISCVMEGEVEFVSCGGATRGTGSGANVTFEPLASLAPKAVATWTVVIRGKAVGDTRFLCVLNTKETGRKIEKTESTRIYK
jgi:uncharacterized repeat protein (TIGR01451 family)